jgi:hypothetical protein
MFVSPFFSPLLYLPIFLLSSSPLLSLSGSILSRIFMITTSRVGGLEDAHLHLYRHIMSLTNHRPFQYLANYLTARSQVSPIELLCPVFRHIHLSPETYVIYNSALDSSNSPASLSPGSQKFQTIYRSLPSLATLVPFPMHIHYAFTSDNSPQRFEKIGINKQTVDVVL